MRTEPTIIPGFVADLVALTLNCLGLQSPSVVDDMITVPLEYGDGSDLSLVLYCVTQRRWLVRDRPMIMLTLVRLNEDRLPIQVFSGELIPPPTGPDDFPFMVALSAKVRATAWSIAVTGGMGECVSLPGRVQVRGRHTLSPPIR